MPTKVVLSRQRWENHHVWHSLGFRHVSARPALLETALGAFRHTWRRPRRSTARLRRSQALAELDDRLLRDIGAIRERGGVSADAARREVDKLFWGP